MCNKTNKKTSKSAKAEYNCHFNYPGEFNEWITIYALQNCGYSEKALKLLADLDNFCDGFVECACYQVYRAESEEANKIPAYKKENVIKTLNNIGSKTLNITFSKEEQEKIKKHKTFPFVFIRDLKNGKFKGSNKMKLYDSSEFAEFIVKYKENLMKHQKS